LKLQAGQIVKMSGTRDKGFRIIDRITERWQGDIDIICRQLAIKPKDNLLAGDKICYVYNVKGKSFVLYETNYMTTHMPNKVRQVLYKGGWLKIADYESLVEIN